MIVLKAILLLASLGALWALAALVSNLFSSWLIAKNERDAAKRVEATLEAIQDARAKRGDG